MPKDIPLSQGSIVYFTWGGEAPRKEHWHKAEIVHFSLVMGDIVAHIVAEDGRGALLKGSDILGLPCPHCHGQGHIGLDLCP